MLDREILEAIAHGTELPSRRLVCQLSFNNGLRVLTNPGDRCRITFIRDGAQVSARMVTVSVNQVSLIGADPIFVSINEPVTTSTVPAIGGSGIPVYFNNINSRYLLIRDIEVNFIEIGIGIGQFPNSYVINQSEPLSATNENITVYAFGYEGQT